MDVHGCRVSNGLSCLVHTIVLACLVEDPHMEQVDQDRIIDPGPINPLKPFSSLDHICPEPIVKEEIWVHVPPPPVLDNSLIIRLVLLNHPKVGVLGYL